MEPGQQEEQKISTETYTEEHDITTRLENPASPHEIAERGSQLEVALFTQTFYCQDKSELKEHTLSVTPNYLMADDQASTNVSLQNVIGATVAKVSPIERSKLRGNNLPADLYSLIVHVYPKVISKSFFGSAKQVRQSFDLVYYTKDEKLANDWRNLILQAANTPSFMTTARQYENIDQIPRFRRLLLVFVNPHSGKKLGPARWAIGKQFLLKAGCEFVEVFTEYSGHARDYVVKNEAQELLKFDGIVTVSGDGLPHEVINGLCSRPDWDQIKHIPLGPLPGGSGNAIVKNLLSRAGEETSVKNACYLIVKGKSLDADLTVLDFPGKPPVYSFLSFVWAAMAHIDIDSEVIRWMGAFRFDLFGALSIVKMKKYRAKLTFSQHITDLPPLDEEITGEGWTSSEEDFTYFCLHKMPYITDADLAAPIKDFRDGYNHLLALKGSGNTRAKMTKLLLGLGSGMLGDEAKVRKAGIFYEKIKSFRLEVPNVPNNFYSVDGEKYESNKVQGRIQEKALRFFCTK